MAIPRHLLLEVEPAPVIERDGAERVAVARAFGDLADVKVPFLHRHTKEVTRLTLGAARRLGLADTEIAHLELAALLHDVGRVGVSNAVWEKPGPLTSVEWEQVRMHGYYFERILAASPSLDRIATMAGMHHERLDGSGYHRCSTGSALPRCGTDPRSRRRHCSAAQRAPAPGRLRCRCGRGGAGRRGASAAPGPGSRAGGAPGRSASQAWRAGGAPGGALRS